VRRPHRSRFGVVLGSARGAMVIPHAPPGMRLCSKSPLYLRTSAPGTRWVNVVKRHMGDRTDTKAVGRLTSRLRDGFGLQPGLREKKSRSPGEGLCPILVIRPDVHARFRHLVERTIVKADQAHAEFFPKYIDLSTEEGGYPPSYQQDGGAA
jgi:hypothetical protein